MAKISIYHYDKASVILPVAAVVVVVGVSLVVFTVDTSSDRNKKLFRYEAL